MPQTHAPPSRGLESPPASPPHLNCRRRRRGAPEIMLLRPAMSLARPRPRVAMVLQRSLCDSPKSDSPKSDSMHSSDIAFKPNDDGWGYTNKYSSGWDRIFAKKGDEAPAEAAASAEQSDAAASLLQQQQEALSAAHSCGALSDALYAQAKLELEK